MPKKVQNSTTKKAPPKATKPRKTPSKPRKKAVDSKAVENYKMKYELKLIVLVGLTIFLMLCLYTTAVGTLGIWVKYFLFGCFSYVAYGVPLVIFALYLVRLNPNFRPAIKRVTLGTLLLLIGVLLGNTLLQYQNDVRGLLLERTQFYTWQSIVSIYQNSALLKGGGVFGELMAYGLLKIVGVAGTLIILLISLISGFIVFTRISLTDLWEQKRQQKQLKRVEKAANDEAIIEQIAREKEAERLQLEQIKAEKAMEKVRESVKRKHTDAEIDPPSAFLAQLDMAKKAARQKEVSKFDYDSYEEGPKTKSEAKAEPPSKDEMPQVESPITANAIQSEPLVAHDIFSDELDLFETAVETPKSAIPVMPIQQSVETVNQNSKTKVSSISKAGSEVDEDISEAEVTQALETGNKRVVAEYIMPPLDLLSDPVGSTDADDKSEFYQMAQRLEETLGNFNVEAKVLSVKKGPAITMFEVQLSPGIKVSKVVGLSDDIALNLATSQVRIAPIPGKTAIGIEVPNKTKSMVVMKEVLESDAFKTHESKLAVGLGKDIAGNPIIGDLGSMPHLLIAGATGSGKSVCVNTIVCSILLNAKPDEVKFLMIDPKVVELSNYNGIPHLILPVVTDPKKAAIALNWAVNEMTRRYKLFADTGCRDMKGYNRKIEESEEEKLAQIVVIIDELADLMMVAPNQVEDAICRLAQMARAAGIHLIVATQRPSVDVITGVIKANIPSRIAFSVSSAVDSRTIIDMAGAEKLLGKGDMLYYPIGAAKPKRAQGAFMSDEEVEALVSFIKNQTEEVSYNEDILEDTQKLSTPDESVDEFLEEAIQFVVTSEQASASLLQRRFRVGYNRAARLVDAMEERGIIGPARGSKPREVLLTMAELQKLKSNDSDEPEQMYREVETSEEPESHLETEMRDYE